MKFLKRAFRSRGRKYVHVINGEQVSLGDHYNLEAHIDQVLAAYAIDTIIDVGANKGQFGSRMRNLGFRGDIYSFEPVKEVFESLSACAAGDNRWKTYNIALGAEAGKTQMNVSASSDFSSLLAPNEFGEARFKGIKTDRQEDIAVHRLDEFLKQTVDIKDRRILLKIDAQGYDLQVFGGAAGILGNVCALLSEISFIPIYHGMNPYLETLAIYQKAGFSMSGIYPVCRNKDDLSLIEMDCMMVNPKKYG